MLILLVPIQGGDVCHLMQQTLVCPHGRNERTLFPTSAEHISASYNADCVVDAAHYYPSLTSGTALILKLPSASRIMTCFLQLPQQLGRWNSWALVEAYVTDLARYLTLQAYIPGSTIVEVDCDANCEIGAQ